MTKVRLTADNIENFKSSELPEWVLDVTDKLLAKKWSGTSCTLYFDDVKEALVNYMMSKMDYSERRLCEAEIQRENYLDIEFHYRTVGFKVDVDVPHYSDNYKGHYKFYKAGK